MVLIRGPRWRVTRIKEYLSKLPLTKEERNIVKYLTNSEWVHLLHYKGEHEFTCAATIDHHWSVYKAEKVRVEKKQRELRPRNSGFVDYGHLAYNNCADDF